MKIITLLLLFFVLASPRSVFARFDPLSRQNNKFGIHIADVNDIADVALLVNSSGGDWGYVTLVIQEGERDPGRWQTIFDQMRRLHIIPIVRLATHLEGASWVKPRKDDINSWVTFFNRLNWPIENRYIVVFNEPNHAKEWGNSLSPEEYADYIIDFSKALKPTNEDFFILPAGLDASAGNTANTMDEATYLERIVRAKPDFLSVIDGWTSHAYPNPGFSAPVTNKGRGSLYTYRWELDFLSNLGLNKELPVFITETGWMHKFGIREISFYLSPEEVADNLRYAAGNIWTDRRIVAVTPFLFNYQGEPFDHFSWKKMGTNDYYPHFYAYQSLVKQKGYPKQREQYMFESPILPDTLVAGSRYTIKGNLKNLGQAIVDSKDNFDIAVKDPTKEFTFFFESLPVIEPGQIGSVVIHVQTPKRPGLYPLEVMLRHNQELIKIEGNELFLVPPPSLSIHANLAWRQKNDAGDASVFIYKDAQLLHKFTGVAFTNGTATIEGLTNIVPGQTYRVVVLIPFYLPRQSIKVLTDSVTELTMKRFLPFDYNKDGALTFNDLWALFGLQPHAVFSLFMGN